MAKKSSDRSQHKETKFLTAAEVSTQIRQFKLDGLFPDAEGLSARLSETKKALTEALAEQTPVWAELSAAIAENLRAFDRALEKSEGLGRLGWTVPMDITLLEISGLLDTITDEASADAAFLEFYTADDQTRLKSLLSGTLENPGLKHWKPLIEEALWCLQKKQYRVCITALLPILDGLCASRFTLANFHMKRKRKEYFDQRRRVALEDPSVTKWMWLSFIGFCETLLRDVDFANPSYPPVILNRHLLLHGRDIPRARLEDCIRLLLALDMITNLPDASELTGVDVNQIST